MAQPLRRGEPHSVIHQPDGQLSLDPSHAPLWMLNCFCIRKARMRSLETPVAAFANHRKKASAPR